jgi:uncharacterized protein YdhG (YjbR/CyaY superfamily)
MPMPKRTSVDDYFDQLAAVEAAGYEAGQGFIKLPYARELPTDLLRTLMRARVQEYATSDSSENDR